MIKHTVDNVLKETDNAQPEQEPYIPLANFQDTTTANCVNTMVTDSRIWHHSKFLRLPVFLRFTITTLTSWGMQLVNLRAWSIQFPRGHFVTIHPLSVARMNRTYTLQGWMFLWKNLGWLWLAYYANFRAIFTCYNSYISTVCKKTVGTTLCQCRLRMWACSGTTTYWRWS